MKFSLITVCEGFPTPAYLPGDRVSGYWIQNHVGTLETAQTRARRIEEVNGGRIHVAVVDEIPSSVPCLNFWSHLLRLG